LVDIAIIRNNFIVYDTGLVRVIRSLCRSYSTVVFGWNREKKKDYDSDSLKKEIIGNDTPRYGNLELKILKLNAPVRKPALSAYLPLIFFFPMFWTWVFVKLVKCNPKILFACDVDTVIPCYIYKKIFRKKLAFYVFDRYALTYIPQKYKMLFNIVHKTEEYFSNNSDILITVGENVLNTFHKKPRDCSIIPNYPQDIIGKKSEERHQNNILTIVYGGHIKLGRGLEKIASAVKDLQGVQFFMHGLLIDPKLLNALISIPNVKYKGHLMNTDSYYKSVIDADVMIAVYDLGNPSNSITMHNKTFEAMMCGIPIITNLSPQLVEKIGFGITVDYENIPQIRAAIILLRDNVELRKTMGKNGRNAFLEKYNWTVSEKELYSVCGRLLADKVH
jgi:glycosyltransferase involved in cell wall biosynthesis